jgi:hypothetical protein
MNPGERSTWTAVAAVAGSVLIATASGPAPVPGATGGDGTVLGVTATGAPTRPVTSDAPADDPSPAAAIDPACTRATKVKIVRTPTGTGGTYSFTPRRLTIRRGAFLAVTNASGQVHALVSTPDAGIVTSVLDRDERQVIQFPKSGRFTVRSASPAHPVLQVTVSGESGCGATKPMVRIVAGNSFRPATLSLRATQNFAVMNDSGVAQTVICSPGPNGDNSRLDRDETQLLALDEPGRYICSSRQHPDARVTIRVR